MDTFELGNFTLTTGFTLPNAKLAYTPHGTLNAAKDNAILFTNFIGGTDQELEVFIGEDFALDPRKYFIILPGQFGNGFSSSPEQYATSLRPGRLPADQRRRRYCCSAPPGDGAPRHPGAAACRWLVGGRITDIRMGGSLPGDGQAGCANGGRTSALCLDPSVVAQRGRRADHRRSGLGQWLLRERTRSAGWGAPPGACDRADGSAV